VRIAANFQESQDLKAAGFPQGTSFFRWYWRDGWQPQLVPKHEKWQWATVLGKPNRLFDGYPMDWPDGEFEWCDAPTVEEILDWKPSAALIAAPGVRHACADGRIEIAATMADALARAVAPRGR